MADYPALNVQSPDVLGSMNNVLGLQSKKLALQKQAQDIQTGQYQQQTAQAGAATNQMALAERQRVAAYISDPKNRGKKAADMADDIHTLAPTTGEDYLSKIRDGEVVATNLNRAKNSLTGELQDRVGTIAGSFTGSGASNADIEAALDNQVKQNPQLAETAYWTKQQMQHLPDPTKPPPGMTPQQAVQVRDKMLAQYQYSMTGKSPLVAGTQDAGATIQPITSSAVVGGQTPVGPPVTRTIPPGYTVVNGQLVRADNTGLSLPANRGDSASSPAPTGKLQPTPRPGINPDPGDQARYNANMEEGRQHVAAVSAAANDINNGVGATRYRNSQLKTILQRQIANNAPNITGPGSDTLHWVASHTPGFTQYASDFDTINHYLAQNSAAAAKAMGVPGTNAGADTAASATGSTHQTPTALLEVTKTNDAMNSGLAMYKEGLAKVSKNGADPSKVAAFRNAWGSAFDVNVMRYDDALRDGDAAEVNALKAKLGPAGLKELGAKRRVLHSLAETGDLP